MTQFNWLTRLAQRDCLDVFGKNTTASTQNLGATVCPLCANARIPCWRKIFS